MHGVCLPFLKPRNMLIRKKAKKNIVYIFTYTILL